MKKNKEEEYRNNIKLCKSCKEQKVQKAKTTKSRKKVQQFVYLKSIYLCDALLEGFMKGYNMLDVWV